MFSSGFVSQLLIGACIYMKRFLFLIPFVVFDSRFVATFPLFSDAGLLGAALVYVLQLGGLFQWSVRQSAEVGGWVLSYFSIWDGTDMVLRKRNGDIWTGNPLVR